MRSASPWAGKLSARDLCLLGLMGALMFALQLALAPLPNIHLTAPLVILTAVCFSWRAFYAVAVFVLLEALVWGIGLWTLSYFYVWPAFTLAAVLMRRNDSAIVWAAAAAVFGLCFGALCAIPYFFIGGAKMAFSYWISGIPFDLVHCGGNFVLTLVLYRPMKNAMLRALEKRN